MRRDTDIIESRSDWSSVAILAILSLFLPFARLETNDDVQIMLWASGVGAGGLAQSDLIFVHPLLGYCLRTLYAAFPLVEWYGVVLVTFSFASLLVINRFLLSDGERATGAEHAMTVALAIPFVLQLQYTRIAILMGFVGTVGLIGKFPTQFNKRLFADCLWALILFTGVLVRFDGAALGFLLGILFSVIRYRRLEAQLWSSWSRLLVLAVFGFGAPIAIENAMIQADPTMRASRDQLFAIKPFSDLGLHRRICTNEACAVLTNGIWTANDFVLIDNFITEDEAVFSTENTKRVQTRLFPKGTDVVARFKLRFSSILGAIPATPVSVGSASSVRLDGGRSVESRSAGPAVAAPRTRAIEKLKGMLKSGEFLVFAAMLCIVCFGSNYERVVESALVAGISLALVGAITIATKFPPERVLAPILILLATIFVATAFSDARLMGVRWRKFAALGAVVAYTTLSIAQQWTRLHHYDALRTAILSQLPTAHSVIVMSSMSTPAQTFWYPFGGNAALNRHSWLVLGWASNLAGNLSAAKAAFLNRPLVDTACGEKSVFLGDQLNARALEIFALEHAHQNCRLRPLAGHQVNVQPWRLWIGSASERAIREF